MLPIIEVTAKTCYTLTVYIPAIPIRNFQRSYIMKLFSDIAEKITNKWEDIKLRVYSRQVIPKSKSYWGLFYFFLFNKRGTSADGYRRHPSDYKYRNLSSFWRKG